MPIFYLSKVSLCLFGRNQTLVFLHTIPMHPTAYTWWYRVPCHSVACETPCALHMVLCAAFWHTLLYTACKFHGAVYCMPFFLYCALHLGTRCLVHNLYKELASKPVLPAQTTTMYIRTSALCHLPYCRFRTNHGQAFMPVRSVCPPHGRLCGRLRHIWSRCSTVDVWVACQYAPAAPTVKSH